MSCWNRTKRRLPALATHKKMGLKRGVLGMKMVPAARNKNSAGAALVHCKMELGRELVRHEC